MTISIFKPLLSTAILAGSLTAGAETVVFQDNFENPATAAKWTMTGRVVKNGQYALSRFLDIGGKKMLSLQDFDWGGDPMKTTATTPQFSPCETWTIEYDFSFAPGSGKKHSYNADLFLLAEDGSKIANLPIVYDPKTNVGKFLGEFPLKSGNFYHVRMSLRNDDHLYDLTLSDSATGEKHEFKERKLAKYAKLAALRFEAVSGWENMGMLNIDNLTVTECGAPVPRNRESIGKLENNRLKLNFCRDGKTELSFCSPDGRWVRLGVIGAPELPGARAVPEQFRSVKLENDTPSPPRINYDLIASATQVAGSGNQVLGVSALGADGKPLYLMQWTLFPESARLRIYPAGEIPSEWGKDLAAIPFLPAPGIEERERFAPDRSYLHPTGGEPETVVRGQLIDFGGKDGAVSIAASGEMPTYWQFHRDGKLYSEIKEVKLPWRKDFRCGTITFAAAQNAEARRREALARAGDERLLMEVTSDDPFFLMAAPGTWRLTAHVGNYFRKPQRIDVHCRIVDYDGKVLKEKTISKIVPPGGEWAAPIEVKLDRVGPVYADIYASHEFAGDYRRICGGILPEYPFRAGAESRFGISSFRSTAGPHSELRTPQQMFRLMKRIGVSLIRQCYRNETLAHSMGLRTWYANDLTGPDVKHYFDGEKNWMSDPANRVKFLISNLERTRQGGSEVFEFTNEWNISDPQSSKEKSRAWLYAKDWLPSLKEARDKNYPDIKIAGLSIANGDMNYMETVHELGGWDKFDYLVFHASGVPRSPEVDSDYWSYMKTLETIREALRKFGDKPLYISEFYAPVAPNLSVSNNERIGADDLALEFAFNTALDVKNSMFYCFDDFDRPHMSGRRQPEPVERERYFGLVRRNWIPKATLWSYATAARFFDPGDFLGDLKFDDPAVRGLLFDRGPNGKFAVLWSRKDGLRDHEIATPQTFHRAPWVPSGVNPPVPVTLTAEGRELRVTDAVGETTVIPVGTDGKAVISLTESPVYVEGAVLTPVEGEFFQKLSPKYKGK